MLINELTYVAYSSFFSFFEQKILITFNAEKNTSLFKRLDHILEREIQSWNEVANKAQQENIHTYIWLKVILQYYAEFFWFIQTGFGSFYPVFACSCLSQLVMGCSTFYIKKVKAAKAGKARKKMGAFKEREK